MKISICPWYESKEGISVDIGPAEVTCSQVYSGIGIQTDSGLFGIAERDGVIEILHNGDILLDSDQIKALIERKVRSEIFPHCTFLFQDRSTCPGFGMDAEGKDCEYRDSNGKCHSADRFKIWARAEPIFKAELSLEHKKDPSAGDDSEP
jgi:hypothetical protein